MTRTQTPLSRWWKSPKNHLQSVIALACVGVLSASVICNVRAHGYSANLDQMALTVSAKFNSITSMKAPPYRSTTDLSAKDTVLPWLMDCEGDRVRLSMQYDSERHTLIDIVGVVQPNLESGAVTLKTEGGAIQKSLETLKTMGALPEKCQVRVTKAHYFVRPHMWRVIWEIKMPDETLFSISTMIDGITGLPMHVHNGKY